VGDENLFMNNENTNNINEKKRKSIKPKAKESETIKNFNSCQCNLIFGCKELIPMLNTDANSTISKKKKKEEMMKCTKCMTALISHACYSEMLNSRKDILEPDKCRTCNSLLKVQEPFMKTIIGKKKKKYLNYCCYCLIFVINDQY
jgi:hypothetical protein